MAENKEYTRGDTFDVEGREATVTGTGFNNGNPEYTVAFNDPETDRPVSVGHLLAPQAHANNHTEILALNAERDEQVAAESAAATEEVVKEEKAADRRAAADSGDDKLSEEAKSKPADNKTPVTNSTPVKPGTATPKSSK